MKPLLYIVIILLPIIGLAQSAKIDSLKNEFTQKQNVNKYAEQYQILTELCNQCLLEHDTVEYISATIQLAETSRGGGSFVEALNILKGLEDSPYAIPDIHRINFYLVKGSILYEISEHKQAIHWARKGLQLAKETNYDRDNGLLYNLLGASYTHNITDSAIFYLKESTKFFMARKDPTGVALPNINLARIYRETNRPDEAIKVIYESLEILDVSDIPIYRKMAYEYLAMLYVDKGDYQKGMKYVRLRDSVNFKISNNEIRFQINQFQDRLKKEQSENKMVILNGKIDLAEYENRSKNIYIIIGLVLVATLGMMLFFAMKSAKARKEVNILIEKKATELEELNMFKNKVISVISHDMRTPLAQIITLHQAKNSGINFSDIELQEMERTILASTKSGLLILDNLLKWANSQLGGLAVKKERLNSRMLLSHILNQVSQLAKEKNIQINTRLEEAEMVTDEGLFEIVMRNILSNAIKFSPLDSTIQIISKSENGCLMIGVLDQGPGIPDSVIEKLEGKEVIKPKTGSFGEKGAGIGLTFSTEFAKKIGGSLNCVKAEQGGTLATFKVPLEENGSCT